MAQLAKNGRYTIDPDVKNILDRNFIGSFCDEENTALTIKNTFNNYNYLCDTHTAVGLNCAERYIKLTDDTRKMLVTSTASPYKFSADVYKALTDKTLENEFDTIAALTELTAVPVPQPLTDIDKREIRFEKVIEASDMAAEVLTAIG